MDIKKIGTVLALTFMLSGTTALPIASTVVYAANEYYSVPENGNGRNARNLRPGENYTSIAERKEQARRQYEERQAEARAQAERERGNSGGSSGSDGYTGAGVGDSPNLGNGSANGTGADDRHIAGSTIDKKEELNGSHTLITPEGKKATPRVEYMGTADFEKKWKSYENEAKDFCQKEAPNLGYDPKVACNEFVLSDVIGCMLENDDKGLLADKNANASEKGERCLLVLQASLSRDGITGEKKENKGFVGLLQETFGDTFTSINSAYENSWIANTTACKILGCDSLGGVALLAGMTALTVATGGVGGVSFLGGIAARTGARALVGATTRILGEKAGEIVLRRAPIAIKNLDAAETFLATRWKQVEEVSSKGITSLARARDFLINGSWKDPDKVQKALKAVKDARAFTANGEVLIKEGAVASKAELQALTRANIEYDIQYFKHYGEEEIVKALKALKPQTWASEATTFATKEAAMTNSALESTYNIAKASGAGSKWLARVGMGAGFVGLEVPKFADTIQTKQQHYSKEFAKEDFYANATQGEDPRLTKIRAMGKVYAEQQEKLGNIAAEINQLKGYTARTNNDYTMTSSMSPLEATKGLGDSPLSAAMGQNQKVTDEFAAAEKINQLKREEAQITEANKALESYLDKSAPTVKEIVGQDEWEAFLKRTN